MVFIAVGNISLILWAVFGQRKLLSASFTNLMGTIIFVVLGLQFDSYTDRWTSIWIGIGFYLFIVIGERTARYIPINKERFQRFGQFLLNNMTSRFILTIIFLIFALLPVFQVLFSSQSIKELFFATWGTDTTQETTQKLLEISEKSASGFEALAKGIQTQMIGFFYLSAGFLLIRKKRWFYPVFAAYLFGSFFTCGGFRSLLMVTILFPFLLVLLSIKKLRFKKILLFGILSVMILMSLDWLRNARSGMETDGNFLEKAERTLRADFAFGGLGLKMGLDNLPDSIDRGVNYLLRVALLPIPRILWPGKSNINPNQEYTEQETGKRYEEVGMILLFTPLGEALYNFGYFGVVMIPFLYGFLVVLLERIYLTSNTYKGLLVQVYIWSFLAMRLSFYNLFLVLVASNFILICIIIIGSRMIKNSHLIQ